MNYEITRLNTLDRSVQQDAIRIFINGFYSIFKNISKDKDILQELFSISFDHSMVYVYLCDGQAAGLISIGTHDSRSVKIRKDICQKLFGKIKGFVLYKQLGAMMSKINVSGPRECYIDFLTTNNKMRGKGVGRTLLEYVFSFPEYDTYVLDVLENNTTAKQLYERCGFKTIKISANPIKMLGGFGKSVFMRRPNLS